jgi:osmotically-inducible protein OsmY
MAIDIRTAIPTTRSAAPSAPTQTETPRAGLAVLVTGGRVGTVERVLTDPATGVARDLVVRLGWFFPRRRVVPASWIADVGDGAVTLRASRAEVVGLPAHRSDDRILSDLRSNLRDDDPIRLLGMRYTRLDVVDGVATLRGRVPSRAMAHRMVEIAGRTSGVRGVVDELVADDALEIAVAQAIGHAPATRGSRLVIRADRGHVTVGGAFPSADAHVEAVRIAAGVDGVAGATASLWRR